MGNPPRENWLFSTWLFTLLGRRNSQTCDFIPIHGLWLMVWLDGEGLGRNMNGKLMTRKFREEVRI